MLHILIHNNYTIYKVKKQCAKLNYQIQNRGNIFAHFCLVFYFTIFTISLTTSFIVLFEVLIIKS